MKRYSSFLKRPEILETVYSVESEDGNEGGKNEEKKEAEETNEPGTNDNDNNDDDTSKDTSLNKKPKLVQMKRMESETTSFDWSTDSESLRYEHKFKSLKVAKPEQDMFCRQTERFRWF